MIHKDSVCYHLFTFHSTHSALFMEKALKDAGVPVKLIPVPRSISSSCGLAARVPVEERERVHQIIISENLETDGIYIMEDSNIRPVI